MSVSAALRKAVCVRAEDRCEYCGLAQAGQETAFHIMPVVVGGETVLENLALACVSCSLRKVARRQAADPETGEMAPLFHPRREVWNRHFRRDDGDRARHRCRARYEPPARAGDPNRRYALEPAPASPQLK
jgi:hypothetical protein